MANDSKSAKEHLSEIQKGGAQFYRIDVRRAIHLEDSVAATRRGANEKVNE